MKTPALSVNKIRAIERKAIEEIGIPSIILMENAGRVAAEEALRELRSFKKGSVCVFCGTGNNGGDGFVLARHLINKGVKTNIFIVGKKNKLRGGAAMNYKILKQLTPKIYTVKDIDNFVRTKIKSARLVVDALFGTGLSRSVEDPYLSFIELINASKKKVIALDIPSGLDGTTGKILGVAVKAKKTVTFAFAKAGFYKNSGPACAGEVIVADIGIPRWLNKK
ncbi:MAG: NAD(P)H-hydrate epimerase [Candidatus Omnitrophica bacterium]|nr:NAD(P)H-hydrate epimerase [Candidatus Omnitrophota bacterium]